MEEAGSLNEFIRFVDAYSPLKYASSKACVSAFEAAENSATLAVKTLNLRRDQFGKR